MIQDLFNSDGRWIAFRKDNVVFDREGRWIGWLPWSDGQVVDPDGEYVGTIVDGDRLYWDSARKQHDFPGYPGWKSNVEADHYPGFLRPVALPPDMTDVVIEEVHLV